MPKIDETNLWQWLSKSRQYYKRDLDLQRVENLIDTGTPDVEGHLRGCNSFWVELKALEAPKEAVRHNVTQDQISWIYNRWITGGTVAVLFQFGSGASATKLILPGSEILRLQEPITWPELLEKSLEASGFTPQGVVYALANLRSP